MAKTTTTPTTTYRIQLQDRRGSTELLPDVYTSKREATRWADAWDETLIALDPENVNPLTVRVVPGRRPRKGR